MIIADNNSSCSSRFRCSCPAKAAAAAAGDRRKRRRRRRQGDEENDDDDDGSGGDFVGAVAAVDDGEGRTRRRRTRLRLWRSRRRFLPLAVDLRPSAINVVVVAVLLFVAALGGGGTHNNKNINAAMGFGGGLSLFATRRRGNRMTTTTTTSWSRRFPTTVPSFATTPCRRRRRQEAPFSLPSSSLRAAAGSSSSATTTTTDSLTRTRRQPRNNRNDDGNGGSTFNNNSSKLRVKRMFRRAKDLERKGQWRKASGILRDILALHPTDAHSHLALARLEARRGQRQQQQQQQQYHRQHQQPYHHNSDDSSSSSSSSVPKTTTIVVEPHGNNDHNSTARIGVVDKAAEAFANGTAACPSSVHLWQAWAVHEYCRSDNPDRARTLFRRALELDSYNPYVCHAYGLMERKLGNGDEAKRLWERALQKSSTAALVCSLGELLIAQRSYDEARNLYGKHAHLVGTGRERTEIYLASAWLEERYFEDFDRAERLIELSLECSPTSSVAQVALARLEGRKQRAKHHRDLQNHNNDNNNNENQQHRNRRQQGHGGDGGGRGGGDDASEAARTATIRRLASTCIGSENGKSEHRPADGRVYNAWANIEVKAGRLGAARKILQQGLTRYPKDHSLLQAAGKVEERIGNHTGARELYGASLHVQPSAPSLVAYALLDLRHPEPGTTRNVTKSIRLFEEALLLDPRHGPAYNAYARAVFLHKGDVEEARRVYERGVQAQCRDTASIYHGYARLELSVGNVDEARRLLVKGWKATQRHAVGTDYPHRDRALFLSHTLGMLELNRGHPVDALNVFQDGIERYGNSSQLLLGAALCEVSLGNDERARKLFERSVLSDERHAQAWQAWGVMEMKAGNIQVAKTLFECGIKSAPRHGALWQAYATMESRFGNIQSARGLFEAGVKKAPSHIPLYQSWAVTELRERNFTAAKALIAQALTRDKRNGDGWVIAAEIEERLGNDGLASLLLRRGIECSPTKPELYRSLGDSLVRKGKINEAREIYEQGINVDARYAPLYHSLAELEARVFNVDGLAALHKRAAAIFNTNALEPPATSSELLSAKIRANRSRHVPKGVAALAQRIVDDDGISDLTSDGADPDASLLDTMSASLLEEDGFVSDLLR